MGGTEGRRGAGRRGGGGRGGGSRSSFSCGSIADFKTALDAATVHAVALGLALARGAIGSLAFTGEAVQEVVVVVVAACFFGASTRSDFGGRLGFLGGGGRGGRRGRREGGGRGGCAFLSFLSSSSSFSLGDSSGRRRRAL